MTIFQAIFLGVVQGLTEMLPVSSSAHLIILPMLFGWNIPEWFDVALHFGTLLAIAIYFFKDWLTLIRNGFNYVVKKEKTVQGRMFWYIVLATIPGGAVGYILDKFFEDTLRKPIIISLALMVMGIVLYVSDKKSKNKIAYEQMTLKQTFWIGITQALAFIPGVSRSGITITTARLMEIKRDAAARFSFMLSAPIVLGATIFKLKDFVFNIECIAGILFSFIIGLIVIKFLLNYIQKKSYKVFAIYRVILGIIILLVTIIRA